MISNCRYSILGLCYTLYNINDINRPKTEYRTPYTSHIFVKQLSEYVKITSLIDLDKWLCWQSISIVWVNCHCVNSWIRIQIREGFSKKQQKKPSKRTLCHHVCISQLSFSVHFNGSKVFVIYFLVYLFVCLFVPFSCTSYQSPTNLIS